MSEIKTEFVSVKVSNGETMNMYTAIPRNETNVPGLLLFQEAFGVNAHIRDVAERFAREGYGVVAPELFHRTAPGFEGSYTDFSSAMQHTQALTNEGLTEDIRTAYEWLNRHPSVKKDHIASTGYCLGGRVSVLANVTVPLKVSISYYGGGIAAMAGDKLKNISSPLLLFWGGLDKHITKDQIDIVTNALTEHDKDFTSVIFSKADHGFFCDARASYHPVSARYAWALTLEFLAANLH